MEAVTMHKRNLFYASFIIIVLLVASANVQAVPVRYFFLDTLLEYVYPATSGSQITGYMEIDNEYVTFESSETYFIQDWDLVLDYQFNVDTSTDPVNWNKADSDEGVLSLVLYEAYPDQLYIEYFASTNDWGYTLTVDNFSTFIEARLLTGNSSPEIGFADTTSVPEPATLLLLGFALLGLFICWRQRS
jgi:hypothetical protein